MDDTFQISAPRSPTTGDYLSFSIADGGRELEGRISGTALAILGSAGSREETFLANIERIRHAAYEKRRRNPDVDLVILGSGEFS